MTIPQDIQAAVMSLPLPDRADLAQQLAESVRADLTAEPLTPDQLARVRKTIACIEDGSIVCEPFDRVMQELRTRL